MLGAEVGCDVTVLNVCLIFLIKSGVNSCRNVNMQIFSSGDLAVVFTSEWW